MRIGSLFSGIGGLELGLEWAGVGHTVWQVEQDRHCLHWLAQQWPDAQRFTDVREVGAHNLPPVDVICGGFPCQDISYVGKGAGLAGERSGLWFEFARIVGEMGPRYVVVENVAALLTRGIDAVLGTLADLGYNAEWSTLRASDVGAPHRRERVFLVAYAHREHGPQPHVGPQQSREHAPRREHAGGEGATEGESRQEAEKRAVREGLRHPCDDRPAIGRDGVGDAEQSGSQGYAWNGDDRSQSGRNRARSGGPTATADIRVGWADATPVRGADGTVRLIPAEAAARGPESPVWPVAHGVPGRVARLRAIGNAVVPQVAEVVGRRLLEIDAALRQESAA